MRPLRPPRRTTRRACSLSSSPASSPSATCASVQRAIDAQLSAQSITSNDEMMDLVTDIEQTNNAWAVGRFDLIASQAKLPDEIATQDSPGQVARVAGHVNGGVSAQLRAEANDDQAAENLRGVLNGVISLAQAPGSERSEADSLVKSLQLSGSGKTVRLSFAVPAEIFELMSRRSAGGAFRVGTRDSRIGRLDPAGLSFAGDAPARAVQSRPSATAASCAIPPRPCIFSRARSARLRG